MKKGYGKKTVEANFHEMKKKHPEMPAKQRAAAVLSTAEKAAKAAGKPSKAPKRRAAKGKAK